MASLDTLHDSYEKRWRRFLLWVTPLGILAFVICLIFERPSHQYLRFDVIAYSISAVFMLVLELLLLFRSDLVRQTITLFVVGVSSFFLVRITYLMIILQGGVDIPAQLSEGFYWIPVIYLLSLALPGSLFHKRIRTLFTALFVFAASIFISLAIYQQMWDAAYAISELALANFAIFLLARTLAQYKDDLVSTQVQLNLTEHYAYVDSVTNLPNRLQLETYLDKRLKEAKAEGSSFAVLFIDFDNFKLINDVLGHEAGDQVLKTISSRMQKIIGKSDFLARQSGDEFVVVSSPNKSKEDLQKLATRLREAVYAPLTLGNDHTQLTASIGMSFYPDSASSAAELLRQADAAMYRVKHSGKNGAVFFDTQVDDRSESQFVEQDIRYALERQEMSLVAQPIVNLHTEQIVRFEVLARWTHTTKGPISPGLFIPAAERNGFIVTLGEWILREACSRAKLWLESFPELRISVNVSRVQVSHPEFIVMVKRILDETGFDPNHLDLEMTESVLDNNLEQVQDCLTQLRQLGIGLMMDDFGKGYSSLSYLKDFPFDVIKLDRAFVQDLSLEQESGAYGKAILSGVSQIAKHLNLELVAEGIETKVQQQQCIALGYHLGQGYYFSKPVDFSLVPELITKKNSLLPLQLELREQDSLKMS